MNTKSTEFRTSIRNHAFVLIGAILTTFLAIILLLSKVIPVIPDVAFAHLLVKISIPITILTLIFQFLYFKLSMKKFQKDDKTTRSTTLLLRTFSIRFNITLIPILLNIVFLCLTNFDMFLVFNVILILWMINIFPFPDKISRFYETENK